MTSKNKTVLALGADIKNRFLLAKNGSFYFGPHLGDLSEAKNFARFKKEVSKALRMTRPNIIACDFHPDYFSSLLAKQFSLQLKAYSLQLVQHHHAHIASVLQEHNLIGPVIGVSFDGTGYGTDGNSWGGEFLLVNKAGFKRLAHLKYRLMPGGDKVVHQPWRMVLSILGQQAQPWLRKVNKKEQQLILTMLAKKINCPQTSSAGRLFDAAAALLGICPAARYEAEGPIKLEALSDSRINQSYRFATIKQEGCRVIDTDVIFLGMLKDLRQGRSKGEIASKFHNSMAQIIVNTVKKLAQKLKVKHVALSGGVFQNKFLLKKTIQGINNLSLKPITNIKTPVNDYNISLGQYYVSSHSGKS